MFQFIVLNLTQNNCWMIGRILIQNSFQISEKMERILQYTYIDLVIRQWCGKPCPFPEKLFNGQLPELPMPAKFEPFPFTILWVGIWNFSNNYKNFPLSSKNWYMIKLTHFQQTIKFYGILLFSDLKMPKLHLQISHQFLNDQKLQKCYFYDCSISNSIGVGYHYPFSRVFYFMFFFILFTGVYKNGKKIVNWCCCWEFS